MWAWPGRNVSFCGRPATHSTHSNLTTRRGQSPEEQAADAKDVADWERELREHEASLQARLPAETQLRCWLFAIL